MANPELSMDALFDLLTDRRRRYLLYCLDQKVDAVVTVDELTAMLLDWERRMNAGTEEETADLERRIRIALHHRHLPKLADAGLVEYDPRSQTVRKRGSASAVAFGQETRDEVPYLQSLFCTAANDTQ